MVIVHTYTLYSQIDDDGHYSYHYVIQYYILMCVFHHQKLYDERIVQRKCTYKMILMDSSPESQQLENVTQYV